MKATIEQALGISPFSMTRLYSAVWPLIQSHASLSVPLSDLEKRLASISPTLFTKVIQAIIRRSFLIQAVTTIGGSGNMRVRWEDGLKESQRYCPFEDCMEIAGSLLNELAGGWMDTPENQETLELFGAYPILSYEMPIDYRERIAPEDIATLIHRKGNLGWHCDPILLNTLRLRKALRNPEINPDYRFFKGGLKKKIVLMAYLTGRAQTGAFKTNRETRWEAHPRSPQFALYTACAHVEHKLMLQICDFDGFPISTRKALEDLGLVSEQAETCVDPITLEPFNYAAFRNDVENSAHGTGYYQLGHIEPLRSEVSDLQSFGHSAQNISWITADGNRIQGKSSVPEIRKLLITIAKRYEERNLIPDTE